MAAAIGSTPGPFVGWPCRAVTAKISEKPAAAAVSRSDSDRRHRHRPTTDSIHTHTHTHNERVYCALPRRDRDVSFPRSFVPGNETA